MLTLMVQTASPVTASAVAFRCELASKFVMVTGVPAIGMSEPLFSWVTIRFPSLSGETMLSDDICLAANGVPAMLGPPSCAKPRENAPIFAFGEASAVADHVPVLAESHAELRDASVASLLRAHLLTCS